MSIIAICLMGPTASGKTDLALKLSDKLPVELISVDSTQIYRQLNIGSGKLPENILQKYPHHLIDILDPHETYSAADFSTRAWSLIQDINKKGRIPLLVGGTMMYFNALITGLHNLPGQDPKIRQEIETKAAECGWPALHQQLMRIDPKTATRLGENDKQRIQRALEVYYITGLPLSKHIQKAKTSPNCRFVNLSLVDLTTPRKILHQRIEKRFNHMLEQGLIDELQYVKETYPLQSNMPSMRSVGYRQVWSYLEGVLSREQMIDDALTATRQLAKRQLTWLRRWPNMNRLDFHDIDLEEKALNLVRQNIECSTQSVFA